MMVIVIVMVLVLVLVPSIGEVRAGPSREHWCSRLWTCCTRFASPQADIPPCSDPNQAMAGNGYLFPMET
jgi:hypothetical protein